MIVGLTFQNQNDQNISVTEGQDIVFHPHNLGREHAASKIRLILMPTSN
jgi:energy-coupling factor transporter ATP-binding protein EcfA2